VFLFSYCRLLSIFVCQHDYNDCRMKGKMGMCNSQLRKVTLGICLLAALCCAVALQAGAVSDDPRESAVLFQEALVEGGWVRASRFCADPGILLNWSPPAVTKYIVFPSIKEIKAVAARIEGDMATVTLSMSAIDFDAVTEDGLTLRDELLSNLNLGDEYAAGDELYDEAMVWLIHGSAEWMTKADGYRKRYEIPYILRRTGNEWYIDLAATLAYRHPARVTVTPLSYGILTYDYAQRRYYAIDAVVDGLLSCPDDLDWGRCLQRFSRDEIFSALGTPAWNVWLRLKAEGDAEGLYDFSVDNAAQCALLPVAYAEFGCWAYTRRWAAIQNEQRAALEMYIPVNVGRPLEGYTVACRHRSSIWTPWYAEEVLSFSLDGTPYDTGYPAGSVTFTVDHFMRVNAVSRQRYNETITADTLGVLMKDEFDKEYMSESVFLNVPEGIADLPILNNEYALYRLEGTITKESGYFGVYDVTFGLETPVDGVWIEAYEQCPSCDVIDMFDLLGKESTLMETLQRSFDIQVLIRVDGRTDEELEMLIRTLKFAATFSAEEWDFSYEEHGTTTRIGPRSTLPLDMSGMTRWTGTLGDLPRAEWK
jgi:hypothetical protein